MMRFVLIALLAFLIPAAANAQEPHVGSRIDREVYRDAHVDVVPDGEDLVVTIVLRNPVSRLRFQRADVVRDDAFVIDNPGLEFSENEIRSDMPFDTVTFRVIEDLTERDAKYPPYYRVGEGRLLYAPAIYPSSDQWDVTFSLEGLGDGWTRWPDAPLPHGYLFIGPEDMVVEEGGARFVFDGNGDADFEREIRANIVLSLQFLEGMFGSPPASAPFIATSIMESDRSFSTGDVTDNAMIGLRFMGDAPDPTAPGALATTRSIILHEGVHFWNGGVASFSQGTPMWLHEGGAEYLATLASFQLGWTSQEDLKLSIGRWLDTCSTSLGWADEVALHEIDFIPANMRYSCGPLLHFLAELYLGEQPGEADVISTWRDTVDTAAVSESAEYSLDDWVSASGDTDLLSRPALAAILATSGPERWDTVNAEIARLGVEIGEVSNPALRARTALMYLARAQCTGLEPGQGYGFYSGAETYRMDTPPGCGLLTGNPVIATLAGSPITTISAEDYSRMQQLCANGDTIPLGKADGEIIEVPCSGPLPDAATEAAISALPDIPAFRR